MKDAKPLVFGFILASLAVSPTRADDLSAKLMPLITAHRGQVAVAVKHLASGESFAHRADVPMPTASLIKLAVMVEAYRQAEEKTREKKLDLAKMVTLRAEDKVPGSGILTNHFSPGMTLSVRDAIRLMIVYSDNTATNLVLDRIGLDATAKTMESLGFTNTKIHSKVFRGDTTIFPDRSKKFGLGSTTAAEMEKLFELLHQRKLVSREASDAMHEHLLACDAKSMLPAMLPHGTKIAHKSGSVNAVRCDAGIVYASGGPIAVCVMTAENKDQSWTDENEGYRLGAKIGRLVYDHFSKDNSAGVKPASK